MARNPTDLIVRMGRPPWETSFWNRMKGLLSGSSWPVELLIASSLASMTGTDRSVTERKQAWSKEGRAIIRTAGCDVKRFPSTRNLVSDKAQVKLFDHIYLGW